MGCLIYHSWKKETDYNIPELMKYIEQGKTITIDLIKIFKYKTCKSCGKRLTKEYTMRQDEPKEWTESKKDLRARKIKEIFNSIK